MGVETERKFLTNGLLKKALFGKKSTFIKQGYLSVEAEKTIRIRIAGEHAFITIKGKGAISRPEFEYEIPVDDANQMLELFAEKIIEKERYNIDFKGFCWEVDVFHGENEGLVIAELELESETDEFPLPEWISKEVTGEKQYYNSYLSLHAYKNWKISS